MTCNAPDFPECFSSVKHKIHVTRMSSSEGLEFKFIVLVSREVPRLKPLTNLVCKDRMISRINHTKPLYPYNASNLRTMSSLEKDPFYLRYAAASEEIDCCEVY